MRAGQVALGAGTVILAFTLYFAGRTTPEKKSTEAVAHQGISFDDYEVQQVAKLLPTEKEQYSKITTSIKNTPLADTAKLKQLYLQASSFWKDIGNVSLGGYYFYRFAEKDATALSLASAGDIFVSAFKSGSDSTISNNLITFALRSYEDALKLKNDVEIRIKLAEVYVQASPEPMKGIGMLRELADSLPDNVPVGLALGRLSIQSGQYDKAKERLKHVLEIDPQNTEALYFMAIAEAELGHHDEAIRLFEMCKQIVGNKDFDKEVDEIIKNLKSKKV